MKHPADDTTGAEVASGFRDVPSVADPIAEDDRTVQHVPRISSTSEAESDRDEATMTAMVGHAAAMMSGPFGAIAINERNPKDEETVLRGFEVEPSGRALQPAHAAGRLPDGDDSITVQGPPAPRFPPPRPAAGQAPDDAPPSDPPTMLRRSTSDAYTTEESVTARGPARLNSYHDDSVTAPKPVAPKPAALEHPPLFGAGAKPTTTARTSLSGSGLGMAPAPRPPVDYASLSGLVDGSRGQAPPPERYPSGASFTSGRPAGGTSSHPPGPYAPPLQPPPGTDGAKKPRYALLVALVAFVSFAVPVALFLWRSGGAPTAAREASVVEDNHVDRGDPTRAKKTPGALAAPAASSSPPPPSRWYPKKR